MGEGTYSKGVLSMPFSSLARRFKLSPESNEWPGFTRRVVIDGHKFYVTINVHPDRRVARIFIRTPKSGSTISGFAHAFAQSISDGLQLGESLQDLRDRYMGTRFEPLGFTSDADIKEVSSVIDYVFQLLDLKLLKKEETAPSELAKTG